MFHVRRHLVPASSGVRWIGRPRQIDDEIPQTLTVNRPQARQGAAGGRLSLQSITVPDAGYEGQRRGANWIQTYIFPGGLCPSLAVIEGATRDTRLLITQVTDIAADYVRTLRAWRLRFTEQADAARSMGFDDRFVRMWEYYLALCEAGFATGATQDLQIGFHKRRVIA